MLTAVRALASDFVLPQNLTSQEKSFLSAVSHAIVTTDEKLLAEFTYPAHQPGIELLLRCYRTLLAGGAQKISIERIDPAEATEVLSERVAPRCVHQYRCIGLFAFTTPQTGERR